jgi:hypothetical protein
MTARGEPACALDLATPEVRPGSSSWSRCSSTRTPTSPCILGDTFKQDCNDLRNIKVPDIHRELRPFEPAGQG